MNNKKFISNDVFLGSFLAVFSIIFLVQALRFPNNVGFFPSIILIAMLVLSLLCAAIGIYKTVQTRQGKADYKNPEMKKFPWIVLGTLAIYVFCMKRIGFFVSTAVFLPCEMLLFGQRRIIPIILSTVFVLAFLYFLVLRLNIYMPDGFLF